MKTTELPVLMKSCDSTWDHTALSIWSALELSVGILVASLPPLRKQFEALFRKLLPSAFLDSRSKQRPSDNGIPLYNVSKQFTIGSKPGRQSQLNADNDADSERYILRDPEQVGKGEDCGS
jgi:hypothetical protein